jgi:hypothetical protein
VAGFCPRFENNVEMAHTMTAKKKSSISTVSFIPMIYDSVKGLDLALKGRKIPMLSSLACAWHAQHILAVLRSRQPQRRRERVGRGEANNSQGGQHCNIGYHLFHATSNNSVKSPLMLHSIWISGRARRVYNTSAECRPFIHLGSVYLSCRHQYYLKILAE